MKMHNIEIFEDTSLEYTPEQATVASEQIEEFEKQSAEYKESVLPASVKARVCVEAGSPYSWYKYAGTYGETVCMTSFGASAPAGKLFPYFGFTAENIEAKALVSIEKAKA